MKISPITSKEGDTVKPTRETLEADAELRQLLDGCDDCIGTVTYVFHDKRHYPIAVEFENGTIYSFEEHELE